MPAWRIFNEPDPAVEPVACADAIHSQSNCVVLAPGAGHWSIVADLCRTLGIRGSLVTDACFAALAIEHDCECNSTDRDFARFPGLRWRSPLD